MEKLLATGKVKGIGVCNVSSWHLDFLNRQSEADGVPAV